MRARIFSSPLELVPAKAASADEVASGFIS